MNEANVHEEKKRLENPPQTVEIRIARREKTGGSVAAARLFENRVELINFCGQVESP